MINGPIMTDYLYLGWIGLLAHTYLLDQLANITDDIATNFGNPMCFQVEEDINAKI